MRGLVASYQYGGGWALLRMIRAQSPGVPMLSQLSDRRPEALGFSLALKPNPAAAGGGDSTLAAAQVFMHFGLTASVHAPGQPDKHQPVTLPEFPASAPQPGRAMQSQDAALPQAPAPMAGGNKPIILHP